MPKKKCYTPTNKQLEVLFFIREYCNTNRGRPPTQREIEVHFHWRSTRAVSYHTEKLVKHGLLFKQPGLRGLTPTTVQEQKIILQNLLLQDA